MRAIIITFSVIGAITLLVFGGFFNALSGFGFDTVSPYNDPFRVAATFVGDIPGLGLALAGLGCALYDAARRGAVNWYIGLFAWPVVPLAAASLMYAGVLAYSENWFAPLAFLPLASLLYGIMALSAGITTPTAVSASSPAIGGRSSVRSPVRFAVFVGLLVLAMLGGGAVLLLPNVQPANTGPSAGPALQVTETSTTADCATGVYPSVTLTNTSAQTLQWTAKSEDPNVAASPVQGNLAPFATAQVAFTGKTAAADVMVQFASGGGDGVAKFGCQPGTSK